MLQPSMNFTSAADTISSKGLSLVLRSGILAALFASAFIAPAADDVEFFETKVRPLLSRNCHACHGPSAMGGLRLDSGDAVRKGGNSGPVVNPDQPDSSLLLQAVRHTHSRLRMPPSGKLPAADIEVLAEWIRHGAHWPAHPPVASPPAAISARQRAHWAFQPVRKPAPPVVRNTAWAHTPIDRFILAKLEEKGIQPVRPAAKLALLRRAYYGLTGLPPAPEDVDSFLKDNSPSAFSRVVDRLLASPRYGERWGRFWLDVARYSDDKLNSTQDEPYPNAWRYRDWVVQAFNEDMPYDLFLKAQIAGDLVDPARKDKLIGGLGFFALSPEFQDDRVDVTGRGFLALTLACATCHDHKFDPIPTRDYYSLLGVFHNTEDSEHPLAPTDVVKEFKFRKTRVEQQEKEAAAFLKVQAEQLAEILAAQSARYLAAARRVHGPEKTDKALVAGEQKLDPEVFDRWLAYLSQPSREHKFLEGWIEEARLPAAAFQQTLLDLIKEKKDIDQTNLIRLKGSEKRSDLAAADLLSLPREKYFLWRDLLSDQRFGDFESGILYFKDGKIDRFLQGQWLAHLNALRDELARRKRDMPAQYPFLHTIADKEKIENLRVRIRGSAENLGEEAPRRFLTALCDGEPKPFTKGSGRLELAEAISSAANPLTARVVVNRVWLHHFGRGIVGTPSNFGELGERPTHPELLDYLAVRLVESGWSFKTLHREIMLSAVYALGAEPVSRNLEADPENKLLWRANCRRLDVESLRDTLLAVSGELDLTPGGAPRKLTDECNHRRTVYGFVSRRKLDGMLSLFDFPNPNNTAEQRILTANPLQQLFFLNSEFIERRAAAFASRLARYDADPERIRQAYRILYGRLPEPGELRLGLEYLKAGGSSSAWARYAQALLSSNELLFLN